TEYVPNGLLTMKTAGPRTTVGGMMKLICPGETKRSGAGTPLTVSVVPASDVGSGNVCAASTRYARFDPKAAAIESAASGPTRKSAALTGVNIPAATTRMTTDLTSVNVPSLAVKSTVRLRPTSDD